MATADDLGLTGTRRQLAAEESLNVRRVFTTGPVRRAPDAVPVRGGGVGGFLRSSAGRVALSPLRAVGIGGLLLAAAPLVFDLFQDDDPAEAAERDLAVSRGSRLREAETQLAESEARFRRLQSQRAELEIEALERRPLERFVEERRAQVQRFQDVQAREAEQIRQFEQQQALLEQQAARERELLQQQLEERRAQAERDAALREQELRVSEFSAFARTLPAGSTAAIGPRGELRSIPPGSSLTPQDIERGLEPLPFSRTVTTGERITQLPGVFVGPGFRFKTPEQALTFLTAARVAGAQPVRRGFGPGR